MKALMVKIIVLTVALSIFAVGYAVKNDLDTNSYLAEAKNLSSQGKYPEAIVKLNNAKVNTISPSTKQEIERLLSDAMLLASSSENFEKGMLFYKAEDYKEAVSYLSSVVPADINYLRAKNYINLSRRVLSSATEVKTVAPTKALINEVNEQAPPSIPSKPEVDQGKLASLKNAINAAAEQKAIADFSIQEANRLKLEQLKCSDKYNSSTFPESDVIMSPSDHDNLVRTCMAGYESMISGYQQKYNAASYQYNEYYRQVNQLLSECPACAAYLK